MRQLIRAVGVLGLAVIVAACSTTSQTNKENTGGLGETASQTVRNHPQTAAGAGIGAAGGAVVGGVTGGAKGAVIGGVLGALAGGVVGNYIERRETTTPETSTPSSSTSGSTVPAPSPTPAQTDTTGATSVRVEQVQAQPSQLRPGDTVNLNATYTISSPADRLVPVRETREVRLNGELVANPTVDVTRQTGTYSSAVPITLPATAREGTYEVTTTVSSGDRRSTSTTSFSVRNQG